MQPSEIVVDGLYQNARGGKRLVIDVANNIVTYMVPGMLTFAPLRMPLDAFAEWAEQVFKR